MIASILTNYLKDNGIDRADLINEINEAVGFEYINRQHLYQWITNNRTPSRLRITVIRDRASEQGNDGLVSLMNAILSAYEQQVVAA